MKDYYLGLDIGTDSVGAAVTDENYRVQKYKGNGMWCVSLFDSANQAAERRLNRTARRRLDRRQQRVSVLQELFASEICKTDPNFFIRLKESALWYDDKTSGDKYLYFNDDGYTDAEYKKDYPTIHHLILDLMSSGEKHDIRLVYTACAYLLAHRGHFLNNADKDKVDEVRSISKIFENLMDWFDSMGLDRPFECEPESFGNVLKETTSVKKREKGFCDLLFNGKKPRKDEEAPYDTGSLLSLISGGTVSLSTLFNNEDYAELENSKISFTAKFDEIEDLLRSDLGDDFGLVEASKLLFDWALLESILEGSSSISETKVRVYEKHSRDLKLLKKFVKKYIPSRYNEVFRKADNSICNYTKYSGNVKSSGRITSPKFEKCDREEFCAYIKKLFRSVTPEPDDKKDFERFIAELDGKTLCPKQVDPDNRVIPYQLYYYELKEILSHASAYTPLLNEKDEYGTVSDKILSLMCFKIPYYVGPLVDKSKSANAWLVRKTEGKILPWNFTEKVDLDECEENFIRRMTCKCTYVAGADVLPKNSLLYTKFTVLNEINNIRINKERISPELKQKIYSKLFERYRRVTVKKIKELLISEGEMKPDDKLEGIDENIKSQLKPYHDFKRLLDSGKLTEEQVEKIIYRITLTTDKQRLKAWLDEFGLSKEDKIYICNLNYSDFGRLSRELLTEIVDVDAGSGEVVHPNIITMLWETNENLMELLSERYGYSKILKRINTEYYSENPVTIDERLAQMYIPNAVKRPIIRTLGIVKEIVKIQGYAPKKIFVEMARDAENDKKGKRTVSRKDRILEYFKGFGDEEVDGLRRELETKTDEQLRGEKLFLYFMQLGICMYTGEKIDINELGSKRYDVDHIFPQSKIKDDSLDNKVLVLSEENGKKSDTYPIRKEIRDKMRPMWDMLNKKGLISPKKYDRLIRNTPFTDEELAGFINRQLVETRQSSKAVASLLSELYPESDIIYVKAGLVSEFRHVYDALKCREINDLHHAKDAYLNIVLGNVYDTKFTRDPLSFIREHRDNGARYSLRIEKMLEHDISRGGVTAWKGDGSTLKTVLEQLEKNNIRYIRYSYRRKGQLFNQNPERKGNAGLVNRKKELPSEKYGGYNNTTASCFALAKYETSLKKQGVIIMPVEVMYQQRFESDSAFADKYAEDVLNSIVTLKKDEYITSVSLLLDRKIIKINTTLEIDGFRANIAHKSSGGKKLVLAPAITLIVSKEQNNYFKALSSANEKIKNGSHLSPTHDKITAEKNIEMFDLLCSKMKARPYCVMFSGIAEKVIGRREKFTALSLEEQVKVLLNILSITKSGRTAGCDLRLIGEAENAAIITINSDISKLKYRSVRLVYQSPTGLYEKYSQNLLDLIKS